MRLPHNWSAGLCFRICKNPVFSRRGSDKSEKKVWFMNMRTTIAQITLRRWESVQFGLHYALLDSIALLGSVSKISPCICLSLVCLVWFETQKAFFTQRGSKGSFRLNMKKANKISNHKSILNQFVSFFFFGQSVSKVQSFSYSKLNGIW